MPQMRSHRRTRAERDWIRVPYDYAPLHHARMGPARHAQAIQSKEDCSERKPEKCGAATGHESSCGFLYC